MESVRICGDAQSEEAHFRLFTDLEGASDAPFEPLSSRFRRLRQHTAAPLRLSVLAVYPDFVPLAPPQVLEAENISEILANPSLDRMTSSSDRIGIYSIHA